MSFDDNFIKKKKKQIRPESLGGGEIAFDTRHFWYHTEETCLL